MSEEKMVPRVRRRERVYTLADEKGAAAPSLVTVRPSGECQVELAGVAVATAKGDLVRLSKRNGAPGASDVLFIVALSPTAFCHALYRMIEREEVDIVVFDGSTLPVSRAGYQAFCRNVPWVDEVEIDASDPGLPSLLAKHWTQHLESELSCQPARDWKSLWAIGAAVVSALATVAAIVLGVVA